MQVKSLVFLAAVASAGPQHVKRAQPFGCSAPRPTENHLAISQAFELEEEAVAAMGNATKTRATINVDTYFHVVASSTSLADGYVTDKMLADQLSVLNSAFAPHDIAFVLKGTDRTVNRAWATDATNAELAMKRQLRKGDYKTLNLYFMPRLNDDAFGYCYFPDADAASPSSEGFLYDGCSIMSSTLPGGSLADYNLGHTATHEVGHWFGLYHTFEGNDCAGTGDLIADTPASASMSDGCPVGRDSCPRQAGVDPIHNYMDYTTDECYEEFTAGQQTRMYSFWNNFRA